MNSIIGYSEILEEDAEDIGQVDFIPDLQKIQGSSQHLLGLINAVLDLSKVEAGRMDVLIETVDIAQMTQDVSMSVYPAAHRKGNTLTLVNESDVATIETDQSKLHQCLLNLLGNANKFTEDGVITLKVSSSADDSQSWVHFTIKDTGIGMTREQLAKAFEPFTQADASTTRRFGGSGLGLTLTKQFAELMGGTLKAKSRYEHGSIFTLTVPNMLQSRRQKSDLVDSQKSYI